MITIICVGKERLDYISPLVDDFQKRLGYWARLEWKIIPPSGFNLERAKRVESVAIINKLATTSGLIWLLDETGQQLSTLELANKLNTISAQSVNLVLVIGGAYGVTEELKKRANFVWSLSKLTFPHQLVRLMVLEQLYRAYSVSRGSKYHHA